MANLQVIIAGFKSSEAGRLARGNRGDLALIWLGLTLIWLGLTLIWFRVYIFERSPSSS